MTSKQKWVARMRAEGRCIDCAKPSPGELSCPDCRAKRAATIKRLRARRKAQGLCIRCGKPRDPFSGRFCAEHVASQRKSSAHRAASIKSKRAMRLAHGLCIDCDAPRANGSAQYCKRHLELHRAADRNYRINKRLEAA